MCLRYLKSCPARRQVDGPDDLSEPLLPLCPVALSMVSLSCHTFFLGSFGFCPLTLLIIPIMHKQIPFVLPLSSMKHHWVCVCAKSDVTPGAPKAVGVCAAFSGTQKWDGSQVHLPQGMNVWKMQWLEGGGGKAQMNISLAHLKD